MSNLYNKNTLRYKLNRKKVIERGEGGQETERTPPLFQSGADSRKSLSTFVHNPHITNGTVTIYDYFV